MSMWSLMEIAIRRFLVFVTLTLIGVALLAGCGGAGGQTAEGGAPTGATPAVRLTPTLTITATASANAGTPTAGPVTLTLDKQQYSANDTITITVTNNGATAIFVADHQTACTIISLEINVNGAWQPIRDCQQMTATRLIEIMAGATSVQKLAPGAGRITNKPWAAGTYRATLTYGIGGSPIPNASKVATSTPFTIS